MARIADAQVASVAVNGVIVDPLMLIAELDVNQDRVRAEANQLQSQHQSQLLTQPLLPLLNPRLRAVLPSPPTTVHSMVNKDLASLDPVVPSHLPSTDLVLLP